MYAYEGDRGLGTILVVDDEECLLKVTDIALTEYGYSVLMAKSAAEALTITKNHAGPIDLLLTDVRMPESNGIHLAAEFKKQHPESSVIYMTAYAPKDVENWLPNETVLPKPFTLDALYALVDESLRVVA